MGNKVEWEKVKGLVYEQIKTYLMFACSYEPNNELLRDAVHRFLTNVLLKPLVGVGALAAFEVKCGQDVNTEAVIGANSFKMEFWWKELDNHHWTIAEFTLAPAGLKLVEKVDEED